VGDDSFFYFQDFLVSRGQQVYERVLADPESLLDGLDPKSGEWPYREIHFRSAAMDVYEERNGTDLPWTFQWSELSGTSIDYDDEEQVKRTFPRIWTHIQERNKPTPD